MIYTNKGVEYNKAIVEKYPFLRARNRWTGKPNETFLYTEIDNIPDGWRKAFGESLCNEIKVENRLQKFLLDMFVRGVMIVPVKVPHTASI